jgi:dephospho-CoA kinase
MTPRIVIGLSGRIGAGKTTIAKRMAFWYGFWNISVSGLLKRILVSRGVRSPVRSDYENLVRELKSFHGNDCIARLMMDEIRSDPGAPLIVLDGIRYFDDNDLLARELPSYVQVHVHTDIALRHARIRARGEKPGESLLTTSELIDQDLLPGERESDRLAALTNLIIDNSDSVARLNVQVSMILAAARYRLNIAP